MSDVTNEIGLFHLSYHTVHMLSTGQQGLVCERKPSVVSAATNAVHLQIEAHPNSVSGNQHIARIRRIVENSRLCQLCACLH